MAHPMVIQKEIKDNAEDLHNFVRDIKLWEEEMKRKDSHLSTDQNNEEVLPPVRRAKLSGKALPKTDVVNNDPKKRILSHDYKSWDRFDVEKACEEMDSENVENVEEDEESAEQKEKYLKEKSLYEKELGNQHVKAGKWDAGIEAYTRAVTAYPKDPIFFANRALCYLKKKKWAAVETDCTEALKLDTTYVKAYLRRAVAREALGRLEDTKHDLSQVLRLEPGNTQAYRDLQRLKASVEKKNENSKGSVIKQSTSQKADNQKELVSLNTDTPQTIKKTDKESLNKAASTSESTSTAETSTEPNWGPCSNTIQPISKPPHLRSKKSLKRIEIHDVDFNARKQVCMRNLPKQQDTSLRTDPPKPAEVKAPAKPRRSGLTLGGTREIPLPPKTSVQFHKSWSAIKDNSHLCYQFLKQIPGEQLAEIFKESLESQMLSRIIETLVLECASDEERWSVLPYLRGLTTVRRFSTLALFLSPTDKSNLTKLFEHCISRGECSLSDIDELRSLYEL